MISINNTRVTVGGARVTPTEIADAAIKQAHPVTFGGVKPTSIFLDVDEVLGNWLGKLLDTFGYEPAGVRRTWAHIEPRPWDVFEVINLSVVEAWHRIDKIGAEFWTNVEPFAHAQELHALCTSLAPTTLLTSPSLHPSSYAGKAEWIFEHFGPNTPHLIGRCKARCAHPRALLIDDSPKNCAEFIAAGGDAIVFPGLGNSLFELADDPLPYMRDQLALRFG